MSGYPNTPSGYGYGNPPPGQAQPYGASPYGAAPPPQGQQPYAPYGAAAPGTKPPKDKPQGGGGGYGGDASHSYGAPSAPYGGAPSAPYGAPYGAAPAGTKPPKEKPQGGGGYGGDGSHSYGAPAAAYPPPAGYGSPFAALVPSAFPPNTDPNVVACFQMADQDGSGLIDDKELQRALSSYNQSFSLRTVHLLMYLFTNSNSRKIGPKEFTAVFYSLQSWRGIFERFDKDRSGKIDINELRDALMSLGFHVSPVVLDLLVSKFDKSGGHSKAIEYDNFIECCLTVKGLTEKFKEKDTSYTGSATFSYEGFMLTVLPFLIA